ncbi:MAG: glycohydrolase toxin TNT-related protein [Gammaproteobacteria bacterium]|nr:glycohydrolase toxin TNT-related protein [Gammaproteobacteria bacterium]MBU0848558.1 glycohydrolase toxin TNT-related protein [Gammaproteobacteria bacterium]MBU1530330.1 glycohydrolase toxin TNT-related protein [Gammaproteobacteria bacterium]MBU1780233.1 glycohydrolase toxin TNT-related protein [Gammaproteobacteria bacterium]MBU2087843.1 glycohydrolase toxin TNT-related protein [Gammaproteobacteria bacterium]
MDFTQILVFGQSVKPGLGFRFRGNYWAFFDKRTELSPWLALHRESINDTELDELLLHGFPRTRTGETVDCTVLTHFGLIEGDFYEDGFFVGRTERQRTAVFTGDLQVVKIPLSANPQKDLLNSNSIYWTSEAKLQRHPAGSPEHERGKALVEMASILLARWREHDTQNLEHKVKNRIAELWDEGAAVAQGAGAAAMGFIQGLWDLIKVSVEFTVNAVKATCNGFETIINSNFAEIQQMLIGAGMAAYRTAQEMIAAVKEGTRLFNLIGSDRLLRTGLFEFLDGYTESVPHLRRLRNAATVVVAIGIEVLLALATLGGSLAVAAARVGARAASAASHVGPFTMAAIRHLASFAKAVEKAQAPKLRAVDNAPSASSPSKTAGKAGESGGGAKGNPQPEPSAKSQGANTPKAAATKTAGEPVSMINGEELLQLVDCTMAGTVGLNWQRTYRSSLAEQGFNTGLGAGWAHPLAQHLQVQADSLNYIDEEGRTVYFKPLKVGQRCTNTSEFLTLARTGDKAYRLQASNGLGLAWHFESHQDNANTCHLVRMEDAFGNALCIDYLDAKPTRIHTSQGTWVLGYNEQGLIAQVAQLAQGVSAEEVANEAADLLGLNQLVLVQYRYNELGQLVGATDAAGFEEKYTFNARNVLVQRTLKSGYNIYFEWELAGEHSRCTRQWGDPIDGKPTYHYRFEWAVNGDPNNGDPNCSAAIDSRSARIEYHFNAQGLPVFERGPEGEVTRTRYNSNGQVLERIDALGHREQFQYNSHGHLVGYTNKLGQPHTFEVNRQGQVLKHTDAAGNSRTNTYTAEGLLASHTDATGATTRYRYNSLGLLCETTNPLGQSTRILYNAQGQVQAQTNALGQSNTYQFDTWGRLASISNPLGRNAWYAYDLMGRCTRASNHEGLSTQYSYSPLGQLESITDPTGRSTVYEYADKLSQPTARIDAQGFKLLYRYDSERNLIELQNENGQSCHFEYDLAERLVKENGFDARVQTYKYNAVGHLVEKQEWGVATAAQPLAYTRYQRDAQGRLLKATHSDGEEATYSYNLQGQLIQASNAHRTLQWEVDAEGRPLVEIQAELQNQHRIEHQYNPAGWLKQTSWHAMGVTANSDPANALPAGNMAYQYNALGWISEINYNGGFLAQFERDSLGREVLRKLSNQVHTQSLYDPQGRLIGQVNRRQNANELAPKLPTVSRRRYCYNPRNQLVRIDDQGHGTSLYQYDVLDRLRTVEGPTPEAFLFDPASNLLEALEGQEATDAQASRALPEPTSPNARRPQQTPGNRLKRQGNRRFTYDERGNRTEETIERGPRQGQVTRYEYNAQNQLVEVTVGGVVTRYTYDALGRRISKASEQNSTISTTTFYWNGDVLLGEVNSGIGQEQNRPNRTYLFEPFSFKPLALVQNNEVFHYHTDHIGTPREITNAKMDVVWSSSFKTYGALAVAHVNEVDNPLRFQGQYYDSETGLHYNRHRYYDPNCGQFTTQDPIGLLGGMNAYQYAPNPMTWVDPWGLKGEEISERVAGNLDESRRARESSRFNEYSDREWPPNRGFESTPETKVLMPGERIDRYGSPYGTYTSPEGTPYRARAPKPGTDLKPYSVYEVTQPIEVRSGSAKPWFGYEGGGTQYEMPKNMKDLEVAGKIKRVK